jgi:hypothetical protein
LFGKGVWPFSRQCFQLSVGTWNSLQRSFAGAGAVCGHYAPVGQSGGVLFLQERRHARTAEANPFSDAVRSCRQGVIPGNRRARCALGIFE